MLDHYYSFIYTFALGRDVGRVGLTEASLASFAQTLVDSEGWLGAGPTGYMGARESSTILFVRVAATVLENLGKDDLSTYRVVRSQQGQYESTSWNSLII